jgi:hypothetical protein
MILREVSILSIKPHLMARLMAFGRTRATRIATAIARLTANQEGTVGVKYQPLDLNEYAG